MADAFVRAYGPAQLGNSATTIYTSPGATQTIIRDILVANTTGGAVTFTMSLGSDAAGTRIFPAVSIPANTVIQLTCGLPVEAGEILQAYAGATSSITLTVSGVQRT